MAVRGMKLEGEKFAEARVKIPNVENTTKEIL